MSRSGYSYDGDAQDIARWRGAVTRSIRGKRGQAFLREMLEALDALDQPRLISGELIVDNAEPEHCGVCAIGSVGLKRGTEMDSLNIEDSEGIARAFGIANALTAEIEFINDEEGLTMETPEERFIRVRKWVESKIVKTEPSPAGTDGSR